MSERMDQARKTQWVAALRSGEYKQTSGALRVTYGSNQPYHCCLGVLCDLYAAEGKGGWSDGPGNGYRWARFYSTAVLPDSVAKDARMPSDDPYLPTGPRRCGSISCNGDGNDEHCLVDHADEYSLAELNDTGFTFDQIADLIDYFL